MEELFEEVVGLAVCVVGSALALLWCIACCVVSALVVVVSLSLVAVWSLFVMTRMAFDSAFRRAQS